MTRRMLDTNTVSYILSARYPAVDRRLRDADPAGLCVSAITFGEVSFGLARRPEATRLRRMAGLFFAEVETLPWTAETGDAYGRLRSRMRQMGKALSPLDMLIAAHAVEAGATLVTSDAAFSHVPGLGAEDWTAN